MKQKSHVFAVGIGIIILVTGVLLFMQKSELSKGIFGLKFKKPTIKEVQKNVNRAVNTATDSARNAVTEVQKTAIQIAADTLKKEAEKIISGVSFESEIVQTAENPKFRVLIVGNGMDKTTLLGKCRSIVNQFKNVSPYSDFADKIEFTCGKFGITVTGAGGTSATPTVNFTSNPKAILAQAKLFLMANAKRIAQRYSQAVILENSYGRAYAIGGLSSAIVFTKDQYGNQKSAKSTGLVFLHEFSHIFACLADEYIDVKEINQINDMATLLGFPTTKNQIDGLKQTCYSVPNCVEKSANGCPTNWFEGCGLVSAGYCRPSADSLMRNNMPYLNVPSANRVKEAANGAKIYKFPTF